MIRFVYVAAEGSAGLAACVGGGAAPWARRATRAEEAAFRQGRQNCFEESARLGIDGLGRAYFLWAIDTAHPDIPPKVKAKAQRTWRCVYLID
jgi:hypothetical protein